MGHHAAEYETLQVGDHVRVRRVDGIGHSRTPSYLIGRRGRIRAVLGRWPNPEELAFERSGLPAVALYGVEFDLPDIWDDYAGAADDRLRCDIYAHWLVPTARDV